VRRRRRIWLEGRLGRCKVKGVQDEIADVIEYLKMGCRAREYGQVYHNVLCWLLLYNEWFFTVLVESSSQECYEFMFECD
jgi:cytochrome b